MKISATILCTIFVLFVTSCSGEPKGMDRRIDGSSEDAAKRSVELLTTELSVEQLTKFTEAYGKLAMQWAFANAFNDSEDPDIAGFLKQIDGKTPQEIIEMVAASGTIENNLKENPEDDAPMEVDLDRPFKIDGIEILITELRIGELQKVDEEYSFTSVPKGEFLLATIHLKNITEGKIIRIQNAWGDTTVTDNFENVYEGPSAVSFSVSSIKGAISSKELRPGDSVTDLLIIAPPLENATDFVLHSDPNFYRSVGNNMLRQLSSESFRMRFSRTEIQRMPNK